MNPKFKYKYEKTLKYDGKCWDHNFCVLTYWGGVNLHIAEYFDSNKILNYSCGLESHYRNPPEYMKYDAPSHEHCWLLKCPCWHDGTSLYAQEHFLPMFLNTSHEVIFTALTQYCDEQVKESE